jgi:hypothetical protein
LASRFAGFGMVEHPARKTSAINPIETTFFIRMQFDMIVGKEKEKDR